MKLEIWIVLITIGLIFNAYHNGKYTKLIMSYKKYFQMVFFAFIGICLWLYVKRDPKQGKNMLLYANNMVKYMPIDKHSMDFMTPIFDLTKSDEENDDGSGGFMNELNKNSSTFSSPSLSSSSFPNKPTKRSVSETRKKYVASQQNWKCGDCHEQLNAWFEVDHKVRLEWGGGNEVENLIALCRNCHGKKTAMENM